MFESKSQHLYHGHRHQRRMDGGDVFKCLTVYLLAVIVFLQTEF